MSVYLLIMEYNNPFIVHKLSKCASLKLEDNPVIWKTYISEALFRNYFFKAIERGNMRHYKDYDFTNDSIDAYILTENAKMIFINSYIIENNEIPADEIFKCITEDTKQKLYKYKQHKFS